MRRAGTLLALAVVLAGCAGLGGETPSASPTLAATGPAPPTATPTPLPSATPTASATPAPSPTPAPTVDVVATAEGQPPSGPDTYPPDVNPLTGLPVDDAALLARPPLIVKVSNQDDDVRPQSGLSYADHVWEYQSEGWAQTRFAAVYYGRAPEYVGSVRSGRPIDTHLLPMYDALLVLSGASKDGYRILLTDDWRERVFREDPDHYYVERLPNVPREGVDYLHSLFARPERVWEVAAEDRGVVLQPELAGLAFDVEPPEGGTPATRLVVDYPEYGPAHSWRYDEAAERWLSWTQIQLEIDPPEATADRDYLTGAQLAFDNVVLVYAEHAWREDFVEVPAIDVELVGRGPGLLLRDGLRYDLTWQRAGEEAMIRVTGTAGEPLPLKPGQTWFHVMVPPGEENAPAVTLDGKELLP